MIFLKIVVHFALFVTLVSCGKSSVDDGKVVSSHAFFENSKRELFYSNSVLTKGIARIGGCTGFFLTNANNDNILVTARHCLNFQATQWCLNGGTAKVEFTGEILRCREIVAGDANHDIVVMKFDDLPRDRSKDFTIGTFDLEVNDRLEMFGFPADPFNPNINFAVTDNCWVRLRLSLNGRLFDNNNSHNQTFSHNCSTYGGNSGGPMVMEGTRIAIGLPNAYYPNNFTNRPDTNFVEGISLGKFAFKFKAQLDRYNIFYQQTKVTSGKSHFKTGRFKSLANPNCSIDLVKINYNTSVYPTFVKMNLIGNQCHGSKDLTCNQDGFCYEGISLVLKLNNPMSFNYFESGFSYTYINL